LQYISAFGLNKYAYVLDFAYNFFGEALLEGSNKAKELIDKIKAEGLQVADQKAKEIEGEAQKKAEGIVDGAQKKAEQLISDAKESIRKIEESTEIALKQASRDMLLSLKKEIEDILQKIISAKVSDSLTIDNMTRIISEISKKAIEENQVEGGIEVTLNAEDLKNLKEGLISSLQKQLEKPIHLKASDDIGKGFTVSFDKGKSSFDFTDTSLAEYLSIYVNEQVAALLKESADTN